ncbi:unnamed protein product, partial [Mesorhabditis spiculigera]
MARNDAVVTPFYMEKLVYNLWFCHPNLLVLLICQPATHLVMLYGRPFRHILFFVGVLDNTVIRWWNTFQDTLVSTTFLIVLAYSIERIVAMVYVHTYDEMWTKRPTLGIGLYLGALIYSFFLIIVYNWGLPLPLVYGSQYVLFTVTSLFFVFLRIASGRAYKKVAERKEATVNERFDTARNLKASQLLLRVAPFKCLTNYVSLGCYFWVWELHTPEYYPLYGVLYYYLSHLQLYVQMLLTILGHSVLEEEALALIGRAKGEKPEEIIEMCSLVLLTFCVWGYVRILKRREFCHPNLLLLLICHPITHLAALYGRPIRHAIHLLGFLSTRILFYWNLSVDTLVSTTFLIVMGYTIERMVAMRYVHRYDEMWTERPTLGIGLFIGALIYSFILLLNYNLWLPLNIAYGAQYVLFATTSFFFIYLYLKCRKAYRKVALKKESTVNERFDTARNLKASMLLLKVAPFKCITNFVSLCLYYWIWEMHSPECFPFYSVLYFYLSHLQLYFQMILTIHGHAQLREEFFWMLGQKRDDNPERVKNVLGRKMIFSEQEQAMMYFNQVSKVWDSSRGEKGQAQARAPGRLLPLRNTRVYAATEAPHSIQ